MYQHETWAEEGCEKHHQHVENLNWHRLVGDIGDGRFALKVVWAVVAVVVAEAYVKIQESAMVDAPDSRQLAFELDEVAVKMNEQRVEVYVEVVMTVEQMLELLGESDAL